MREIAQCIERKEIGTLKIFQAIEEHFLEVMKGLTVILLEVIQGIKPGLKQNFQKGSLWRISTSPIPECRNVDKMKKFFCKVVSCNGMPVKYVQCGNSSTSNIVIRCHILRCTPFSSYTRSCRSLCNRVLNRPKIQFTHISRIVWMVVLSAKLIRPSTKSPEVEVA